MKKFFTFILVLIISQSQGQFYGPESVEFDYVNNRWLISNSSADNILQRDSNGVVSLFVPNVINPHGIEIVDSIMYVCADSMLSAYLLSTGATVFSTSLGASSLNGITHDSSYLYISDFHAKNIYRYEIATGAYSIFVSGLTRNPNGLVHDAANNRCVFVSWGPNTLVMAFDLSTGVVTTVANTTLGNCDGITRDGSGNYYISHWGLNEVVKFDPAFTSPGIPVISGIIKPGDIFYNVLTDSLGVPQLGTGNIVTFYYMGSVASLKGLESIEFDYVNDRWLISNSTDNNIMQIDDNGKLSIFIPNVINPHDIEIAGNTIYVCSDSLLNAYDLTTGASVFSINLGASLLRGITHDSTYLYLSDFNAKNIYRFEMATSNYSIFISGLINNPNGLIYDGANNRCIFVTWGQNAPVMAFDITTGAVTTIVNTTLGDCYGITRDGSGNYYVSDWASNEVVKFDNTFSLAPVAVITGLVKPGGLFYNTLNDTLAVPQLGTVNIVDFYYMGVVASSQEGPESVEFDYANNRWLIASSSEDNIMQRSSNGVLSIFIPNVIDPRGIEIVGNTLYVCSDSLLYAYELNTGASLFSISLGADSLRGITHDTTYLYISDFWARNIYRFEMATTNYSVFISGLLYNPTGLIYDGMNNRCVFVTWGSNAPIMAFDVSTGAVTTLANTVLGNCDGITRDGYGNYYVSDWVLNEVVKFDSFFSLPPVTAITGLSNPADIFYNVLNDSLGVPQLGTPNTVTYYYLGQPVSGINHISHISLLLVYPNPVSGLVTISYEVSGAEVSMSLYSASGSLVKSLFNRVQNSGRQNVNFDTQGLSPGNYFLELMSNHERATKKIIVE